MMSHFMIQTQSQIKQLMERSNAGSSAGPLMSAQSIAPERDAKIRGSLQATSE